MAAPRFNAARPGLSSRINRPVPGVRMPPDNGFGKLGAGLQQAAKAAQSVYDDSMRSKLAHDAAVYSTLVTKEVTDLRTNPNILSADIAGHLQAEKDGTLAKSLADRRGEMLGAYTDPEWRQRAVDMLDERYEGGLNALKVEVYRRGEREEREREAATMQMTVDSAVGLAFDGAPPKGRQEIAGDLFPAVKGGLSENQQATLDRVAGDHVRGYVQAIGQMPAGQRYDAYELAADIYGDEARNAAGTERIESWRNAQVFESAKAVAAVGLAESANAGNPTLMGAIAGDAPSEGALREALSKGKEGARRDGTLAAFDEFLAVKRAEFAVDSSETLGTLMGGIADSQSLVDAVSAFEGGKANFDAMTEEDRRTYMSRGKAALSARGADEFYRIFNARHTSLDVAEGKVAGVMKTLVESGVFEDNETLKMASAAWTATPADLRDPAELGALAQRYVDHGLPIPEDAEEAQRDFAVAVLHAAARAATSEGVRRFFVAEANELEYPDAVQVTASPDETRRELGDNVDMVNAVMAMVSEQARGAPPYRTPESRDAAIQAILEASERWSDDSDLRNEFVIFSDFAEAWFDWYGNKEDVPSAEDLIDLQKRLNAPPPDDEGEQPEQPPRARNASEPLFRFLLGLDRR